MNIQVLTKWYVCMIILYLLSVPIVLAQTFLVVDKFTAKRRSLVMGDEFHFRMNGEKLIRHDFIASLSMNDSTIGLSKASVKIKLSNIAEVYFYNRATDAIQAGGLVLGSGFLIAAAVHPLVDNAQYNARESAIIGTSAIGLTQLTRIFRRRSIKITDGKGRIRILEIRWPKPEGE